VSPTKRPQAGRTTRRVPRMLAGRYVVSRRVGVGGMADVYLAEDTQLHRDVALKILHPQYAGDEGFVERFRREAQAAAKLQHPNIVQIYDWGREGDFNFIVMEYVEGMSLKDYLAEEGPLEIVEATRIARDVLAALAYAHRTGLVHRDIKPGNILIGQDDKVQVTDFGIARAEAASTMTQTGTILGTAYYLSPEQAQGQQLDGRSDIYSLGVVLYEMLTGRRPFEGDSPVSIAYKHVREVPRPPSVYRPDVPRPLEAIVMNGLAKKPEDRYSSAALMARDLEAFGQGKAVTATLKIPDPEDSTQVIRKVGVIQRQATQRPGWLVALALLLLAGGLALGAWSLITLLSSTLGRVDVPKLAGRTPDAANRVLRTDGLIPFFQEGESSMTVPEGLVTRQDPPPGRSVAHGSQVKFWVSTGAPIVNVPDVRGYSVNDAQTVLSRAGLKLGQHTGQFSASPFGTVLDQNPRPNQQVRQGDSVDVTYSQGQQTAIVPDIIGQKEADAAAILANAGFRVNRIHEASDAQPSGSVFDQDPKPQTQAPPGSVVDIFISTGAQSFAMPDERGRPESDARAELESMGLVVKEQSMFNPDPAQRGVVQDQDPEPGTTVNKGETVTLFVGSA
jgi:serine/threonine protein kinase/beta-lactam-binding protein with PASTA domain